MSEETSKPKKKFILPNALKIGTAVVLLLAMLLAMGTVGVKDSRKNPRYCATCHADPYYNGWVETNSYQMAHYHAEAGISCQSCHDRTLEESLSEWKAYVVGYEVPLREREMEMEFCFTCHGSYAEVIAQTTPEITGFERNPHEGHWGELECQTCHKAHRESEDYCSSCHNPVTDDPGWIKPSGDS